jgi:putative aldouronate transport system permease protein
MFLGRKSISRITFEIINAALLLSVVFLCVFPFWHVLMASFSDPGLLNSYPGVIWTPLGGATLKGYEYVLAYKNIWLGYANTLFYVAAQCAITLVLSVIAGYVVSRRRFRYRNALMAFIMFTMLFNGGLIPMYMVVRNLNLIDTRAALLIPSALSTFNIILMRTAILGIPDSLEESARIDGAGEFTICFRIILPLIKATAAVVLLFTAVGKWNEWFSALLYLNDSSKYPLQMVLRDILVRGADITSSSDAMDKTQIYKSLVKYCVIIVSTAPILCVYPFVQKYFVSGVMIGSLKG